MSKKSENVKIYKRCSLNKNHFNTRREQEWAEKLREFEFNCIFGNFSEKIFDNALELSCGSCQYSKFLSIYGKRLLATDYDQNKMTVNNSRNIIFDVLDAQDLSRFDDNEMDLIFSSNLLEHLPQIDKCLRECRRVIKQDGIIVHTIPTHTWKLFCFFLYYPVMIKKVIKHLLGHKKQPNKRECLDNNLRPKTKSLLNRLIPEIHGISNTHLKEFVNFGEKRWLNLFSKNNLEVIGIIRLPLYYGYGYHFCFLLYIGNYIGLSGSTAFILAKSK